MSRLAANLILLLTAVIWGSAFVAQATAMAKMGPVLFTGLRFLLAALVVLPFALREGDGRLFVIRRDSSPGGGGQSWVGPVSALSAVFLAAQLLQQLGIMTTTVTNAGFLTALYVILVPILGIALYRQWPHAVIWPAALIALGGTWLLGGGLDGLRGGDLLVMASAVFWALQVVLVGRAVQTIGRPFFLVFAQSLAGGLVAIVLALAIEPISAESLLRAWPELVYAGAISGGLAFSLQAIAQRHASAADAAVVFSAEAVFAALAAAIVLGERLSLQGWFGCGLILLAVLAVQIVPHIAGTTRKCDPALP